MTIGYQKTNLELPTEVFRQMKRIAADEDLKLKDFLLAAVQHEIARREPKRRNIEIPGKMDAALAELYLESLPTFVVMKDRSARIQWVNSFFANTFKVSLLNIVGHPITDVLRIGGRQKEAIEEHIREAVRAKRPSYKVEGVENMTIRAERFRFEKSMLGDVSFDEGQIKEQGIDVDREVLLRMEHSAVPSVERLFVPFVEAAPVAMAVKRPLDGDSLILWANDAFLKLTTAKTAKGVFGRTTRKVFGLPAGHPILRNEAWVVEHKRAYMGKEELKPDLPRWSLRFPIFDALGNVALLGVVSPDYEQKAAPPRFR